MHIYVVNVTAAVLLLWNDNGFGVDITWGTECLESPGSPRNAGSERRAHSTWCDPEQQRTPETSTNIHVSKQCGATGGKLWSGAGAVEDPTPTLCMYFRGLLLIISSLHWQLGYNSVLPGWGLQPGFIHRDQTAACCESSLMWTTDRQEIHFKSIILIWTKMLT